MHTPGQLTAMLAAGLVAGGTGLSTAAAASSHHRDTVASATARATGSGAPGVVVAVDRDGTIAHYQAGVADRRTGAAPDPDARFRIGSISKTYLATVVLQLVDEHRLSLEDTLAQRLPGVLPRIDERHVTVRMLLDHTSGVPDATRRLIAQRHSLGRGAISPARLVRLARGMAPTNRPGAAFSYSNTNFQLLAMIVARVTGHPYTAAEHTRVLAPLRLRATLTPSARSMLPAPFLRGYAPAGGRLQDATRFNASWAGPSGGIVSTASDVARFGAALQGGRLLPTAALSQMRGDAAERDRRYGLGLQRFATPCGRVVYGHEGGMLGYGSRLATTADGRLSVAVGLSTNETRRTDAAMDRIVDAAVCG